MCNWGPSTVTANLYVVPNSYTPDTNNIALSNIAIPSNETAQLYTFAEKLLLAISRFADSACKVDFA